MSAPSAHPRVRRAAVAGMFYPADPDELRSMLHRLLQGASQPSPALKAIIVPHAGLVYSGPIAASAYRLLRTEADRIRRVVLIGPSHRTPLAGLAVPEADFFETPLGRVPIDRQLRNTVMQLQSAQPTDLPHLYEHSLEVQLPFLQMVLESFLLLPLAAGTATAPEVASVLDKIWGGPETLLVVSTDLSHYYPVALARRTDAITNEAIGRLSPELSGEQACGYVGLNGFLLCARRHGLTIALKDLRNSADTAGEPSRVVGYGAWALYDA